MILSLILDDSGEATGLLLEPPRYFFQKRILKYLWQGHLPDITSLGEAVTPDLLPGLSRTAEMYRQSPRLARSFFREYLQPDIEENLC